MPSTPLKLLYSKYAGHTITGETNNTAETTGDTTTTTTTTTNTTTNNGSLPAILTKKDPTGESAATVADRQLQRLGRELTKLERINMFFSMCQNQYGYSSTSQVFSSVGSANSNTRSCNSRGDKRLNSSPSRFRSRSQDFQSKYKLAALRSSPEHKLVSMSQANSDVHNHQSKNETTSTNSKNECAPFSDVSDLTDHLPYLPVRKTQDSNNNNGVPCENGKVMEITLETRDSLRKSVLPTRGLAAHYNLSKSTKRPASSNSSNSFQTIQIRHRDSSSKPTHQKHLPLVRLPRCQARSPDDDDRLDSCHYQYILDDFSSISSSSVCSSVKSDPASTQVSARANRPSTTRTSSTTLQMRDMLACSMDAGSLQATTTSGKTLSRHNSVTNKSPDNQWPPRYAIIPSWPSYEDIQTLNSCGDHRNILTKMYRKEGRWSRDKNSSIIYQNNSFSMRYPNRKQVHVVPSHTTMECAMCNLYSQQADPTSCPPNTPLVNSRHDHHISQRSHNCSVVANRGTPATNVSSFTNNAQPTSQQTTPTHFSRERSNVAFHRKESNQSSVGSNTSPSNKWVSGGQRNPRTNPAPSSKRVSFSAKDNRELSFTWDTSKVTCIKANV